MNTRRDIEALPGAYIVFYIIHFECALTLGYKMQKMVVARNRTEILIWRTNLIPALRDMEGGINREIRIN